MKKFILAVVILLLVGLNIFLASEWLLAMQDVNLLKTRIHNDQENQKLVAFTQLLADTVLSGNKEISFDDRLNLEKAVRDLNSQDIFNQWEKFTGSTTPEETQQNFTDLIKLLLNKISY